MVSADCSQVFDMRTVYANVAMGTHRQGPPGMKASSASGTIPPPAPLETCPLHPLLCLDDVITMWMSPAPDPNLK